MTSTGPLSGIRVIEIASLAPAPFACMVLADVGADVIREVFEVQDEGQVGLLEEHPSEDQRQDLAAAIDACPVHALSLQD